MASFARPLDTEDEAALSPLDAAYAARFGLEPVVSAASLSFYARSGHAFVAVTDGDVRGFVLAHAVWNGARPVVQVSRLAAAEDDNAAREALLDALTKSAYDAAVYDIQVLVPSDDSAVFGALESKRYTSKAVAVWERVLGSRGQGG